MHRAAVSPRGRAYARWNALWEVWGFGRWGMVPGAGLSRGRSKAVWRKEHPTGLGKQGLCWVGDSCCSRAGLCGAQGRGPGLPGVGGALCAHRAEPALLQMDPIYRETVPGFLSIKVIQLR